MILAIFDLQVIPLLSTKFPVNLPLGSKEDGQNIYFQDAVRDGHLVFPILTISVISDLQVTTILPTKVSVDWTLGSEEVQNRFFSWRP